MKVKPCGHKAHKTALKPQLEWALERLKESGLKNTIPRRAILTALAQAEKPLSSEEIFQDLKKGTSDLVTVYRSLNSLDDVGLLRRHDFGDGVRRYELLTRENHHHHFIRCRICGTVEAFEGCEFEDAIVKTLERRGYQRIHHNLDVQAVCAKCHA